MLENSKNLQDNNIKFFEKIIEEAKDLDLEKIKLILEYMDKNTKEAHEHVRKVQQENNWHQEAMVDKVLNAVGIVACFFGMLAAILLVSNNDDDNNKLK